MALIPLVLILIAIVKLHKKEKSAATRLMLVGNLGLLAKVAILDSLSDFLIRYSSSYSVSNVSSAMTLLGLIGFAFSLIFAIGFLIFVISLQKTK